MNLRKNSYKTKQVLNLKKLFDLIATGCLLAW